MSGNEQKPDEEGGAPITPGSPAGPAAWMTLPCPHFPPGFARPGARRCRGRGLPLCPNCAVRVEEARRGWRWRRRIAIGAVASARWRRRRRRQDCLTASICPSFARKGLGDHHRRGDGAHTGCHAGSGAAARPIRTCCAGAGQDRGPIDTPENWARPSLRNRRGASGADRKPAARPSTDGSTTAIERRREAGLRVPTDEEEARLRERSEDARSRREGYSGRTNRNPAGEIAASGSRMARR